jgi:hypothetical protein
MIRKNRFLKKERADSAKKGPQVYRQSVSLASCRLIMTAKNRLIGTMVRQKMSNF